MKNKAAKKILDKELNKRIRKDAKKRVRKIMKHKVERKIGRKVGRKVCKLTGKIALTGLIFFAVTFGIYMSNMENKLIYNLIYPFLQKHYNSQSRNRKI